MSDAAKQLTATSPIEDFEPLFEMIENTSMGMQAIAEHFGVKRPTVLLWFRQRPELQSRYELAKENQADYLVERIRLISETPMLGEVVETDADGKITKTVKSDMLGHRRLLTDNYKWEAAHLKRKWGDKIQQEVTGEGGKPFTVIVSSVLDRDK